MLRLALIGCGAHSESSHARALAHYAAQHPGEIELTAACDLDIGRADRFCQQYGFARAYSDLEAMLHAEKPDGVICVLPVEQIREVGSLLLQRGIRCVLEKPPGISLAEAKALAATARQSGTPHMVSMNRRFNPYLNLAMAWAERIGPLRYVHGRMVRHARHETDFLWGTGVHIVDAVRHIGGEIADYDLQTLIPPSGSAPWYVITIRFVSGGMGYIEVLPTAGMVEERFELCGDDYRARVTTMGSDGEAIRCWRQGVLEIREDADAPAFLRDGSYEETSAFIRCCLDALPMHPTLDDVLPTLRVCAAAT
jgi:predicted dehydrogenase